MWLLLNALIVLYRAGGYCTKMPKKSMYGKADGFSQGWAPTLDEGVEDGDSEADETSTFRETFGSNDYRQPVIKLRTQCPHCGYSPEAHFSHQEVTTMRQRKPVRGLQMTIPGYRMGITCIRCKEHNDGTGVISIDIDQGRVQTWFALFSKFMQQQRHRRNQ